MAQEQYHLGSVPLYPRSHYVAELRSEIPPEAYEPSRSRLFLVPLYLAIVVAGMCAVALGWIPWYLWPIASIVIGCFMTFQVFISHEGLHGGITRNKSLAYAQGFLGFMPFCLSPRIWMAWHNQTHHAITNQPGDPDAFPTLDEYHQDKNARLAVDLFAVGPHRMRGLLTFMFGFIMQCAHQTHSIDKFKYASGSKKALAYVETAIMIGAWITLAFVVGFVPWIFIFVIPLMIANAIMIAFILTNHSLSPYIPINDPLITGLSVTVPKIVDLLTINFGFHTEHHLFPAMSSRHAKLIRKLCLEHWPERYQALPMGFALMELNRSGRVYKDSMTLFDPDSGKEYKAILPRDRVSADVAA